MINPAVSLQLPAQRLNGARLPTQAPDIVVIGASRGGLAAVCEIANGLHHDFAAIVLIVIHSAPDSPRLLAEIMSRYTPLPVTYACIGEIAEHGHVYIAPPRFHLTFNQLDVLRLDEGDKVRHSRPSVDVLFQSAAQNGGDRVIGVVLTGGDGDGADGLRSISQRGGIAIVQQPRDAVDPSMPNSALEEVTPDFILPVDEIGPMLKHLTTNARPSKDVGTVPVEVGSTE